MGALSLSVCVCGITGIRERPGIASIDKIIMQKHQEMNLMSSFPVHTEIETLVCEKTRETLIGEL